MPPFSLDDPRWQDLRDAYGSGAEVPALLTRAAKDSRPGWHTESAWFDLWSALCHQGDTYTAGYAAVPHLVAIAGTRGLPAGFDPLHLIGCIELARLEGHGPAVPDYLVEAYSAAISRACTLAEQAVGLEPRAEYRAELEGVVAALRGDAVAARAIFDRDLMAEDE